MKRISFILGLLACSASIAQGTQTFRDNSDVSIALSDSNYNRLVVRGDKITAAHFPESAMGMKNEADGSLYVVVTQKEPFTLFLTTENGHHFSATVQTENSLGKTIEFLPETVTASKKSTPNLLQPTSKPHNAELIENLMAHLVQKTSIIGFDIKHHYGEAIRLQEGLVLLPKLTYLGKELKGEVTEIYNGGRNPLDLTENLFLGDGVKAVSLSHPTVLPKQRAYLYRVIEVSHA